jgi:rubrerythrin
VTGQVPLGQIRHLSRDERGLLSMREQIMGSGRAAPEIWRCSMCFYSFFGPSVTGRCPRCGGSARGPE